MATPNADRLYKMESWRTSAMEDSHRHLTAVSQALVEIAAGDREVAGDLGLEGATARAACACLDRHTKHILQASDRIKQIVKASTEALNAGIDARNESIEIQTKLKRVNKSFANMGYSQQASGGSSAPGIPGTGVTTAEVEAQRQAAHAEIDALAKKSLNKLNGRILAAIDTLPPDGHTGQTTAHAGSGDQHSGSESTGDGPAATPNTGSARSATAWGATVDTSLGSPGHHALAGGHGLVAGGSGSAGGHETPAGSGVSLQGTHYSPPSQPTAPRPSAGPSAVRAAGAAPTPSARSAGIARGTTTATRTPTTSAFGGRGTVRGGATGIARPTPANNATRSSGILRGTTTSARTPTTSSKVSGRASGILRGTTTAVRKPTTTAASAGGPGGRTSTQGAGSSSRARILAGGRTPTADGPSQKTTGASRGTDSRGGPAARSASTGARPSQSGVRQGRVRSGSTSRALSSLTGKPDKDKKSRRRNDDTPQSVAPYEDDKTVTFLPAGHRRITNPQPR